VVSRRQITAGWVKQDDALDATDTAGPPRSAGSFERTTGACNEIQALPPIAVHFLANPN
jgi:hypothetical protein